MKRSAVRWVACGLCTAACLVSSRIGGVSVHSKEAGPTIPEQVRDAGGYERIVVSIDRSLELATVVGLADIIAEASTTGGRSFLTKTETDIQTEYPFTVHEVLKSHGRPGLRAGDVLKVRRDSGEVVVGGGTAVVHESGFPPFVAGERYLLFLTSRDKAYVVVGGAQGAFIVGDRVAAAGTPRADIQGPLPSIPRPEFLAEVRALLKFTEH